MWNVIDRFRRHLSRLSLDRLRDIRRTLFYAIVALSLLTCVNGIFGPTSDSYPTNNRSAAQLALVLWMLAHVVLLAIEARLPQVAYVGFLTLAHVLVAVLVHLTSYQPIGYVGALLTYHAALTVIGLVLLDLGPFVGYSLSAAIFHVAHAVYVLRGHSQGEVAGFVTPVAGLWLVSIIMSRLLSKYDRRIASQRDYLETELARRTAIIEDQKQSLIESEKLSAVGRLAGGIAHDFNNIMTSVKLNASVVALRNSSAEESSSRAQAIVEAVGRASDLTEQLLGFARKGKHENAPVDMHAVVGSVAGIIERTVDRRINVHRSLAARRPVVMGDPSQMHQVIMNLVINACEAMPRGGDLTIETSDADGRPNAAGRLLRIAVSDTGEGIPEEVRQHLFEPYVTAKAGRGHGLGLAMIHGIVHNHGGTIAARSEPGSGTVFEVHLPSVGQATSGPAQEPQPAASSGRGTILLVDDDRAILDTLRPVLEGLGYAVLVAGDGAAALDALASARHPIDLVILDLTMPVMDGVECFGKMRSLRPRQRIIVSTGHTQDGVLEDLREAGASGILLKPFDVAEVSRCVAGALKDGD